MWKKYLTFIGIVAAGVLVTAATGGFAPSTANGIVFVNPHPTPPSNSVTNGMLTSSSVQDNVVATNAAIAPTKIATDTSHLWLTNASQTIDGTKTFSSFPSVPTGTPTSSASALSFAYFNANALSANTTGSLPSITGATGTVKTVFGFTGATTSYTVPESINSITISAHGASGGNLANGGGSVGFGDSATATYSAAAGTTFYIQVAGTGHSGDSNGAGAGGYGGGGAGGFSSTTTSGAGGGGGVTLIATNGNFTTSSIVLAVGGGGGASNQNGGNGGLPSGAAGQSSTCGGGGGGTQTAGGAGGAAADGNVASGTAGTSLNGGTGGSELLVLGSSGGGGGAGWFGGGGGGAGDTGVGCGGGGGSSYFNPSLLTATSEAALAATSTGSVTFSYVGPSIAGNNNAGRFTFAATSTTSTVTFASPTWTNTSCTVSPNNATNTWYVSSTANAFSVVFGNAMGIGTSYNYLCLGYQ